MRRQHGLLALGLSALIATTALGGDQSQDSWHGRITESTVAFEATRFTLSDAAIRDASHTRLAVNNDLVDFGAAIHQPVPGGWEVHVYLNFEPEAGAPAQGDIETLVFVNDLGEAESFVFIDEPTFIDDPTTPTGGRQINNEWQYDAVVAALNDSVVSICAGGRLDAGALWFDTDAQLSNSWPTHRKIEVTLEFLNSDETTPVRGLRNIIVKVDVEEDLSAATVLQVRCK